MITTASLESHYASVPSFFLNIRHRLPKTVKILKSRLGPSSTFYIDQLADWIYDQIVKNTKKNQVDLQTVHLDILRKLNTVNSFLPGLHYGPPSQEEVQTFYTEWNKKSNEEEKRKELKDFIEKQLRKGDDKSNLSNGDVKSETYTMITGVFAPPLIMIMKRLGERAPGLKTLEFIPDALFVPAFTIAALIMVKMVQKNVLKQIMEESFAELKKEIFVDDKDKKFTGKSDTSTNQTEQNHSQQKSSSSAEGET